MRYSYDDFHGLESFVLDLDVDDSYQMSSSVDNIEFPTDLNVDEIQNLFNEYIRYGLKFIWKIEIPDKLKDVAETIRETNRHMSSPLKS